MNETSETFFLKNGTAVEFTGLVNLCPRCGIKFRWYRNIKGGDAFPVMKIHGMHVYINHFDRCKRTPVVKKKLKRKVAHVPFLGHQSSKAFSPSVIQAHLRGEIVDIGCGTNR